MKDKLGVGSHRAQEHKGTGAQEHKNTSRKSGVESQESVVDAEHPPNKRRTGLCGNWKDEMKTRLRKNARLKHYDYSSNGYYFVTICCSYVAAERQLCLKYKEIIEKHLQNLEKHEGVKVDYYVLMPDHIHFILILDYPAGKNGVINAVKGKAGALPLHYYVQQFKSKTTLEIKKNGFLDKKFWQPNYYEHIIRNEKALAKIREYIQNNPKKEILKFENFYE